MRGIILAGGLGSRLFPLTKIVTKSLLPIYDKPMIYYPLSILMLSGIKDILIISTPQDIPKFKEFLGDGSNLGINLSYKIQDQPKGIAEAFIIGEKFIGNDNVCLILGDNIFYAHEFTKFLKDIVKMVKNNEGAAVIGYRVKDPERFGVVEFDENDKALSIEEKPKNPKSKYAVVGLYFYDNQVIEISKNLKPSARGELEITDVNKEYLKRGKLYVKKMGRGFAWLDTGTHDSLHYASNFVKTVEDRQGFKIACVEEISYKNKWITKQQFVNLADGLKKSQYGEYLIDLIGEQNEI